MATPQTVQLLTVASRSGTATSAGQAYNGAAGFVKAFVYVDPASEINPAHSLEFWIEKRVGTTWTEVARAGGPMADPASINPHGGQAFGPMGFEIPASLLSNANQIRGGYLTYLTSDGVTPVAISFGIKADLT